VIDVAKLSEAARGGDQSAIEWLTKISGGKTVDEQIRNLGVGYEGGDTGDPYNPYVPPVEESPIEVGPDPAPYPIEMPDDYLYEGLNTWYGE
jgi:hypothetical protein